MKHTVKGLTLAAGVLLAGAAVSNAFLSPAPAPPAAEEGGVGPDIIVGSIFDKQKYGSLDGKVAFAIGTESCNIGDEPADWISGNNRHPVIAQNMYRYHDGRIVQIGMSWLKHGFAALNGTLCGSCQSTGGNSLGVGCSDPYWASLNGSQSNLGPRSEVNAFNGVFAYPFGGPGANDLLDKRIVVEISDMEPANWPGATFFVEAQYIAQDDAQAGNGVNNASYRQINVSGSGTSVNFSLTGSTVREKPAILAWPSLDTGVQTWKIDVPNDGVLYILYKASDNGDGTWRYEYALHNLNVDRSVRGFGVQVPGDVNLSGIGKHVLGHHSGEPYTDYNWKTGVKQGYRFWATKSFNQNPNANALRWGMMNSFWFDADSPPATVSGGVELFKPGGVGDPVRMFFDLTGPS